MHKHYWIPSKNAEGQPDFQLNPKMYPEPIVHARCDTCGDRLWFTEKRWHALPQDTRTPNEQHKPRSQWCSSHEHLESGGKGATGCPYCELDLLRSQLERINTPEIEDFLTAISNEARHQRYRWGTEHDEGKSPDNWLWLIGYLATKATQAERYGDTEKYRHHIITCGAACLNWFANATGQNTTMRVGPPAETIAQEEHH
ncbi:MAG: hypothetical protein CMN85_11020 [Spongiibacteraceae bacterium]|uniref:hypothetical protein n=1 Tax=uncultured Haliea sp. TaxID=622616 RepID=UPI000C4FCD6E|nr:hypothetical protein [Spongiibacteraceae bacterium]|tara:strand:- start:2604 stop:3203 length:600 start_codon:yes stop_codon:yes gene_type:complete